MFTNLRHRINMRVCDCWISIVCHAICLVVPVLSISEGISARAGLYDNVIILRKKKQNFRFF